MELGDKMDGLLMTEKIEKYKRKVKRLIDMLETHRDKDIAFATMEVCLLEVLIGINGNHHDELCELSKTSHGRAWSNMTTQVALWLA